jgi:subtilisin
MRKKALLAAAIAAAFIMSVEAARSTDMNAPLLAKADTVGSVRVIIQFKVDQYKPEGKLASAQAVSGQHQAIAQARQKVIDKLAAYKVTGIKQFATVPYMAMQIDAAGLRGLLADPAMVSVQEDIPVPPALNESIPFIKADQLHLKGFDGTGLTIAILDSGVRNTHEFLDAGKVVSEACYGTTYSGHNSTSLCPGGVASSTAAGSGANCSIAIDEGCSHGTHVAGIAAGTGGSSVVKGVAPGASVIAVQVFSRFDSASICGIPPCILSYSSDQMLALERIYALRSTYNIAAVNMSIGGGQYNSYCDTDPLKAIIDNLRAAGIATVIASGNDGWNGSVSAPGCISSAVTVGATLDTSNSVSSYSNHANMVDLLAPGSDITSATANTDTSYDTWDGTSMATPHVAGAFAVMKQLHSAWTVSEIETLLKTTGVPVTRAGITKPRIDLVATIGLPVLSNPYPAEGATVSSYNAASQGLQIAASKADSCTFYYGTTSPPSSSAAGTLSGGFCKVAAPYSSLNKEGLNYWYVEATNTEGTVRYPVSGSLSFTAENTSRAYPWLKALL